jgi:lambda repressor-like predicted transcriptional regulator
MSDRLHRKFETEDRARFEAAVHELYTSGNLRFFLRDLALRCGYAQTAFTNNALSTAYAAGRQSIANEIAAAITEVDPAFWPGLMKEENDERYTRQQQLDQSSRADSD